MIAFESDRGVSEAIWTIPPGGGTAVQITDDAGSDWLPRWSPCSSKIAFNSDRSGSEDIWVTDLESALESTTFGAVKTLFLQ